MERSTLQPICRRWSSPHFHTSHWWSLTEDYQHSWISPIVHVNSSNLANNSSVIPKFRFKFAWSGLDIGNFCWANIDLTFPMLWRQWLCRNAWWHVKPTGLCNTCIPALKDHDKDPLLVACVSVIKIVSSWVEDNDWISISLVVWPSSVSNIIICMPLTDGYHIPCLHCLRCKSLRWLVWMLSCSQDCWGRPSSQLVS